MVQWPWANFPVPGRPTLWMVVGHHGPTALAVGAGGGCLDIFYYHLSSLSSVSLSLGDGPIQTEILSQRAVKPITTNQPILYFTTANKICTKFIRFIRMKWRLKSNHN